ncbi:hypothetical protein [uncultured Cocleimonas sp.]|uniref:hypothetical protein n=1 Tax=uncultured Cocleimonas sp. TaxID=1051587 RepID=UPI002614BD9F|nr:hypothetical protein [uncultured Cocleimonas sp.]
MKKKYLIGLIIGFSALTSLPTMAEDKPMGFFVTSVGSGKGGDLGGLEGADAHCTKLAKAAGEDKREWRAYLSTEAEGKRGISARDRIGKGPWYNAKGEMIAANLTDLHLYNKTILKESALDENGALVNGRGDKPNRHDILTGSMDDGTAFFPDDKDHTCNNWTSSDKGSAMVGHHDRHGGGNTSWTAAHGTRGCSMDDLAKTGGSGLFYCFAAD